MNNVPESSVTSNKPIETDIKQSTNDIVNLADSRDKPFIIILAVTLPTLALIAILIALIVCYRRRHATVWLQKIEHSNRLQAIVVNLSSSSVQPQLSARKPRLSYRNCIQPRTETIVYNRLSTPPTPHFINPFNEIKSVTEGQNNAAFEEKIVKNDQIPVFRSTNQHAPDLGQQTSNIQKEFPVSLQAPVRTITSALVETIAAHRLSLLTDSNNVSSSLETTTTSNPTHRHSGASSSCSNSSQTVLLFSQRTEL